MGLRIWKGKKLEQLAKLYPNTPNKVLAEKFGCSEIAIRSAAKNHNLKKADDYKKPSGKNLFTPKEIELVKALYPVMSNKEIAAKIGRNTASVKNLSVRLNLKKPEGYLNEGCFKKGMKVWNKGMKGLQIGGKQTQFKKGHQPHNTKEKDYTITQRTDSAGVPYLCIRVALGKWEYLNRWMWKQKHGEIPEGMNVAYKDNNPLNCVIDNLFLETRQENIKRNTIQRYRETNPELYKAIYANIQLKKTITDLNKKRNGKEKKH